MSRKIFEDLNNARFLQEAFDATCRQKFIRATLLRRNTYLILFLVGFICIFIAGFGGRMLLSILSLFLSTISLVVMTKYDTQLAFLKIISKQE